MDFKQKIFFGALGLLVVWFIAIMLFGQLLESQSVYVQFLIAGLPFYVLPSILLGTFLDDGIQKVIGAVCFLAAFDLVIPPESISLTGEIMRQALLSGAAVDVFLATLWQSVGIQGFLLFIFTYGVSFVILLALAVFLLSKKQLWHVVKNA